MSKKDKAIPEEVLIEDEPRLVEAIAPETSEQRDLRLLRERKMQALIDRKDVLERNGLKYEDHTSLDGEEINGECC
jgi:hypothetical protein